MHIKGVLRSLKEEGSGVFRGCKRSQEYFKGSQGFSGGPMGIEGGLRGYEGGSMGFQQGTRGASECLDALQV